MNKTEILLLMQFETPTIPLESICESFLSLSTATAKQRAKAGTLPVPAFRLGESQKAPWLIHAQDLAHYIDLNRDAAKNEWIGNA